MHELAPQQPAGGAGWSSVRSEGVKDERRVRAPSGDSSADSLTSVGAPPSAPAARPLECRRRGRGCGHKEAGAAAAETVLPLDVLFSSARSHWPLWCAPVIRAIRERVMERESESSRVDGSSDVACAASA